MLRCSMPHENCTRASLLIMLAMAMATAAETQVDDLRLVAELRPTSYSSTWSDRLGERSGDGGFESAWATGLGWRHGWGAAGRPWQAVAGIEAIALHETAIGMVSDGLALRLEAGAGFALNHRLTLSLLPMLGYGRVSMDAQPAAADALTLDGPLREMGVRAGVRWKPGDRWSISGEAGWLRSEQRLGADGATLTMSTSGAWAALGLAWTIDPLPRTLE